MEYVQKSLSDVITLSSIVNVHYFEFPRDFYTKEEKHPFHELVYAADGELRIDSDHYAGILREGQMILHSPDENHRLRCDKDAVTTLIIVGFTCKEPLPLSLSTCPITLAASEKKKLAEIVKEGREVFCPPYDIPVYDMKKRKNPAFGAEQMLKNLIEYFLIGVVRRTAADAGHAAGDGAVSIEEITHYLDNNYSEKILLDELAFLFRTNRSTLCARFREANGMSINEYLGQKRLQKALRLMAGGDRSVTEISETLGFQSIHYFTRFFKKMTGLSPSVYRASLPKEQENGG